MFSFHMFTELLSVLLTGNFINSADEANFLFIQLDLLFLVPQLGEGLDNDTEEHPLEQHGLCDEVDHFIEETREVCSFV